MLYLRISYVLLTLYLPYPAPQSLTVPFNSVFSKVFTKDWTISSTFPVLSPSLFSTLFSPFRGREGKKGREEGEGELLYV
jgi:hypothetical protein